MAMFDTAKKVNTKATGAATKKKAEITMVGIRKVAALSAAIKTLTAIMETVGAEVKDEMAAEFVRAGLALKRRPENFRGVDNDASASCELRARSTASKLSTDEVELLTKSGITVETVVTSVDTFVINPKYVEDMAIMAKVEAALSKVKGLPEDFFQKQDGKSAQVVGPNALDELFKLKANKVAELLPVVSVLAIKPKMEVDDLTKVFEIVNELVTPVEEDEED